MNCPRCGSELIPKIINYIVDIPVSSRDLLTIEIRKNQEYEREAKIASNQDSLYLMCPFCSFAGKK